MVQKYNLKISKFNRQVLLKDKVSYFIHDFARFTQYFSRKMLLCLD